MRSTAALPQPRPAAWPPQPASHRGPQQPHRPFSTHLETVEVWPAEFEEFLQTNPLPELSELELELPEWGGEGHAISNSIAILLPLS